MRYRVRLQPAAAVDLEQAYDHAARQAPQTAARWLSRFQQVLRSLERNPDRRALAPENRWSRRELRQYLYGKRSHVYRAVFTIEGETVWILRIRRAVRRPLTRDELETGLDF
jgi:plasmid stabilization system protein ParE